MAQYIDKDALVAEIERRRDNYINSFMADEVYALSDILEYIDTLEIKEVDLEEELKHYCNDYYNCAYPKQLEEENCSEVMPHIVLAAKHFFELGVRIQKEEKYEVPSVSKTEDVSVKSRMEMMDDNLKPIADFILDYAGWNLHKDEWNHPVLEVPLFRVLDALIQRGKPYCAG